jgi:hypothetical protein
MKFIPNTISRSVGRKVLQTKKNSPHIFFAVGLAGVVGGTVLACRATLHLDKELDEIKTDIMSVKGLGEDAKEDHNREYEREYAKDLLYVYGKSSYRLLKLYGPSIVVSGLGVAALTGSHVQLTRRNNALTITLAGVMKAYDEYRLRVAEEIGEDRELELHRAVRNEKVEDEDGKKKVIKVTDPAGWSPYAKIFDETSVYWKKSPELNRMFLECQQRYMNHLLHSRGHVFLNDVYDQLGFERTSAGAVVGWVRDGDGDGFVDFGLFEATSSPFINGFEKSIILDFNVDGSVWDKI